MPFTSNKGFSVQAAGSNAGTWGVDSTTPIAGTSNALNEGVIELVDQALGGVTSLSLSSSNVSLTQAQAQNALLRMTGSLLANISISPAVGVLMTGFYMFENLTSGAFSVTVTNSGGSVVLPQARRGLLWIDTSNGPRILSIVGSVAGELLPAGTGLPFYNTTVPTGWAAIVANDYAIRVVNSGGGGSAGGTLAFSVVFGRTATDGYTLTLADIPSHNHSYTGITLTNSVAGGSNTAGTIASATTTGLSGGGGSHLHGMDMRVAYLNMVVGTRS